MDGKGFVAWRTSVGLTTEQAASALGVSRRTINTYDASDHSLPRYIELACEAIEIRVSKTKPKRSEMTNEFEVSLAAHSVRHGSSGLEFSFYTYYDWDQLQGPSFAKQGYNPQDPEHVEIANRATRTYRDAAIRRDAALMTLWKLEPRDLSHDDWLSSSHRGLAVVRAANERQARMLATMAFGQATRRRTGRKTPVNPWNQNERVSVERIVDARWPESGKARVLDPHIEN